MLYDIQGLAVLVQRLTQRNQYLLYSPRRMHYHVSFTMYCYTQVSSLRYLLPSRYCDGVFSVHFLNALTNPLGSVYPKIDEISFTDAALFSMY